MPRSFRGVWFLIVRKRLRIRGPWKSVKDTTVINWLLILFAVPFVLSRPSLAGLRKDQLDRLYSKIMFLVWRVRLCPASKSDLPARIYSSNRMPKQLDDSTRDTSRISHFLFRPRRFVRIPPVADQFRILPKTSWGIARRIATDIKNLKCYKIY